MAKNTIQVKILGDAKGLTGAIDDADSKLGKFSANVGKAGLALGALGVAAGAGLLKLGGSFDAAVDSLIVGTGATGDALADLETQMTDIFKATPNDLDTIANTVGQVNTMFGFTGDELESISTEMLEMGRLMGSAPEALATSIGQVSNLWGLSVDEVDRYNDVLFVASQNSGATVDKLAGAAQKFGAVWLNAGFSIEEATGFMANAEAAGLDITRLMPGINAAMRKWADNGLVAKDEMNNVFNEIAGATTEAEALSIATESFGAEGAQRLSAGIRSGALDLEGMTDQFADADGAILRTAEQTESWQEKLKILTNQIKAKLAPIAAKVFTKVGELVEKIAPHLETFGNWLGVEIPKAIAKFKPTAEKAFKAVKNAIKSVVDFVQTNWPPVQAILMQVFDWLMANKSVIVGALVAIGAMFAVWAVNAALAAAATLLAAAPVIALVAGLVALGAAIAYAYTNFETFRNVVDTVWQAVQTAVSVVVDFMVGTVWPAIQEVIGFIVDEFQKMQEFVSDNWENIKKTIDRVLGVIKTIIEVNIAIYTKLWDIFGGTIMRAIETVWETISTIISGALDVIKGIIKTVTSLISGDWSGVWAGIQQTFSGVWNVMMAIPAKTLNFIKGEIGRILGAIRDKMGEIWGSIATKADEVWEGIKIGIGLAIDGVIDFVTGIPGRVGSAIGDGFSAIWTNFKKYANKIVDGWNNLSFSLPEVDTHIPGVGKIGGWSIHTPNIPRFHDGGPVGKLAGRLGPDEVPAVLQKGEFVLSRSMLKQINSNGQRGGATVNIEHATFNDGQDAQQLANTINFRMA